jgi:drug/metabolite transporter (DMT)-like permease
VSFVAYHDRSGTTSGTVALIVVVSALWGAPYLLIAVAVEEVAPILVVAGRCAIAAATMLAIAGPDRLRSLRLRHLPWIGVLAVLQYAVPFTLITIGEQSVPSSLAGILIAATPLFVAALAPLVDRSETPAGRQALGLGIGGVVVLLGLDVADASLAGGALIMLAALSYGSNAFVLKLRLADAHPIAIVGTACAGAALLTAVPGAFLMPDRPPSTAALTSIVVLGLGCTGAAFTLFGILNARVGPSRSSVVVYLAPGVAMLLGVLLLDEPFGVSTGFGLGLILAGSWLVARGRTAGRADPAARQP